jgi:hypothetical protein
MKNTNIQKTLLAAALGLTLGFASCGGAASPKDLNNAGETALQSMDYDGAKAIYEEALAALGDDAASADYKTAKLGIIECLAHLNADACVAEFRALAAGGSLEARDYSFIGGLLAGANSVSAGIEIAGDGIKAFPGNGSLDNVLKSLAEKAKTSGNAKDMGALSGLGYL